MTISVLYVDDEVPHLMLAKEYLQSSGEIEVECVSSAEKAIEILKSNSFQIIISDYVMHGMDGIDFLKYVRENYGDVPFILFTGKGKEDVVIEALNTGADYYIRKGDDPAEHFGELETRIRNAVKRAESKEEFEKSEELYQSTLDIQDGLSVSFTPDLVLLSASESYGSYYNKSQDELTGERFLPELSDNDAKRLIKHLSSLNQKKNRTEFEFKHRMQNGDLKWQKWNIEVLFEDDGSVKEILATGQDMAKLTRIKDELKKQEVNYQNAGTDLPKGYDDFDENVSLNFLVDNIPPQGVFSLKKLLKNTREKEFSGIAVATGKKGERFFLIFLKGEPEGAVHVGTEGALYGDNCTLFLGGFDSFQLHTTKFETAHRLVTGCRIFDKSHLRVNSSPDIPDISKNSGKGVGILKIFLFEEGKPLEGYRVSIKKKGKILGNDRTSKKGEVRFNVMYGSYEGVVHSKGRIIRSFSFDFNADNSDITLEFSGDGQDE